MCRLIIMLKTWQYLTFQALKEQYRKTEDNKMARANSHYTPGHAAEFSKRSRLLHPFYIREERASYNPLSDGEKSDIAPENTHYWEEKA